MTPPRTQVQLFVTLTPDLKRDLIREADRRGTSMTHVAVSILTDHYGVSFDVGGRLSRRTPSDSLVLNARVPVALRRRMKAAAARGDRSMEEEARATLREALNNRAAA